MIEFVVFRSLLQRETMLGMPRTLGLLLLVITAAMVGSLGQYWFLIITLITFFIFRLMAKEDPWFFEIVIQAIKIPEELD